MRLRSIVATLGLTAGALAAPGLTPAADAQPCVPGLPGITACAFTEPGYVAGGVVIVDHTYPVSFYAGAYVVCSWGQYYAVEYDSSTGSIVQPVASGPCLL